MNVNKQVGSTDCGLYAIASVACLLLNEDPTTVVFNQKELRLNFIKILETKVVSLFPVLKTRQPADRITKIQKCQVYCLCRMPEDENEMIACDKCQEWFHLICLNMTEIPATEEWFCNECVCSKVTDQLNINM